MRAPQGTKKQQISIHAPPRGATKSQTFGIEIEIFQFTPLREGRPGAGKRFLNQAGHFNSRPSARGDVPAV